MGNRGIMPVSYALMGSLLRKVVAASLWSLSAGEALVAANRPLQLLLLPPPNEIADLMAMRSN